MENLRGFVDSERNIIIAVSQRWEVKPTCAAKKKIKTSNSRKMELLKRDNF